MAAKASAATAAATTHGHNPLANRLQDSSLDDLRPSLPIPYLLEQPVLPLAEVVAPLWGLLSGVDMYVATALSYVPRNDKYAG